jgi:hypothetical protein
MSSVVRWVLILPAAVAVWYVAFLVGLGLYIAVEKFAPPNQMVLGHFVPWLEIGKSSAVVLGASLAAALVMITCTSLAPSNKREVAVATFVIGTVVAIYMGWKFFVVPVLSAIVTGAALLVVVVRRPPVSLPKTSIERTREG